MITFDWARRSLTLVANQSMQPDEPLVSFGFSPFIQSDTSSQKSYWAIGSIIDRSAADQAGLKLGDRIVSLNGIGVSAVIDLCELYNPTSRIYQEMNGNTLRIEIVGKSGKWQVHLTKTSIFSD